MKGILTVLLRIRVLYPLAAFNINADLNTREVISALRNVKAEKYMISREPVRYAG